MDLEKRVKMRLAIYRHIRSHGLDCEHPLNFFERDIDNELRSSTPPPCEAIVTLYLMMDVKFMVALIGQNRRFRSQLTIAEISHVPYHSLHANVQHAFDWAQERRKLAGFPPDSWPMKIPVPRDRRLVWEPVTKEIKEAFKMYHRYIRQGFRPFSVNSQGEPLIPVNRFDPHAGDMMFRAGD